MATFSHDELRDWLADAIERHSVPGAQLAVLDGDDTVEVAAGVLNLNTGHPVTPDALFLPGSIGKLYTATAVLMLADDGRIELDAAIVDYLPELVTQDRDALAKVTVRNLLSHTSGFDGDHFEDTGRGDDALERYVASCASLSQLCPPGTVWSYGNSGYAILGRLLEVVAGDTYENVVQSRILAPLGLTQSVLFPEDALLHAVAAGHSWDPEDATRRVVVPQWGLGRSCGPMGASLIASAADVLRFVQLHLDNGLAPSGDRLLSADAVTAMQEPQIELVDRSVLGAAWGLGWILDEWGGVRVIGHDGNSLGQNAFMRVAPDERFGFCLQTNVDSALSMYRELAADLFEKKLGVRPIPMPVGAANGDANDASRVVGTYEREGLRLEVAASDADVTITFVPSGPAASGAPEMKDLPTEFVEPGVYLVRLPVADDNLSVVFFNPDDADARPSFVHFGGRAARRVA